jgi:riboflavin biosynthesis pyrimidine reductase
VLAGAETIRGGKMFFSVWRPELIELRASLGLPRHPVQVVATLRGIDLEAPLFNDPALRVMFVTVPKFADAMRHAFAERPWLTPILMKEPSDLRTGFEKLRQQGIATLSCVGGRTLARQLIAAGLVQDLYLTKSPRSGGDANTPLTDTPLEGRLVLRKHGTGVDEGVRFEHSRL